MRGPGVASCCLCWTGHKSLQALRAERLYGKGKMRRKRAVIVLGTQDLGLNCAPRLNVNVITGLPGPLPDMKQQKTRSFADFASLLELPTCNMPDDCESPFYRKIE